MKKNALNIILTAAVVIFVISLTTALIVRFSGNKNCAHAVCIEVSEKAPDCVNAGHTAAKKCTVCGEILGCEEIPPLGHAPTELPAVAPTFTSTGLTAGEKCARCGLVFKAQEPVPELNVVSVTADFQPDDYVIYNFTPLSALKNFLSITVLSDDGQTFDASVDDFSLTTVNGEDNLLNYRGTDVTITAAYAGGAFGEPDATKNFSFVCSVNNNLLARFAINDVPDNVYATANATETTSTIDELKNVILVTPYVSSSGRPQGATAVRPLLPDEFTLEIDDHPDFLLPGDNDITLRHILTGKIVTFTLTCIEPEGYTYPDGYAPTVGGG